MGLQETLIMLARVMAGFAFVLGVWIMIQMLVRRQSGCGRDKDPLDYMPNGCAGCAKSAAGQCSRRKATEANRDRLGDSSLDSERSRPIPLFADYQEGKPS